MSRFVDNEIVYVIAHQQDWGDSLKRALPIGTPLLTMEDDDGDQVIVMESVDRLYHLSCDCLSKEKPKPTWNPLTVEELQKVCDTMPGGIESFCKGWGWLQFAQEVEKICREKNS